MKPYKMKHIPTGLYYQPIKHRGSNLFKKGKIYQTKTNGITSTLKEEVYVYAFKNSSVINNTKHILSWEEPQMYSGDQLRAKTYISDWVIENV